MLAIFLEYVILFLKCEKEYVKTKFKTGMNVRLRTYFKRIIGNVKECNDGIITVDWVNHPFRTQSFELEEDLIIVNDRPKQIKE